MKLEKKIILVSVRNIKHILLVLLLFFLFACTKKTSNIIFSITEGKKCAKKPWVVLFSDKKIRFTFRQKTNYVRLSEKEYAKLYLLAKNIIKIGSHHYNVQAMSSYCTEIKVKNVTISFPGSIGDDGTFYSEIDRKGNPSCIFELYDYCRSLVKSNKNSYWNQPSPYSSVK